MYIWDNMRVVLILFLFVYINILINKFVDLYDSYCFGYKCGYVGLVV